MTISIRKSEDRGNIQHGWLHSWHTFSFGRYQDPNFTGFGPLLVINEDKVQPAQGFATHSHDNMEIITYVIKGSLEHKDSMGNGSVIVPGDIQRMSAGTGVTHSEYNHSKSEIVHLLQIWIVPNEMNIAPSYEQINLNKISNSNDLLLIGSNDGRDGSITIHQDVNLYLANLKKDQEINHDIQQGRLVWIQMINGSVTINQNSIREGDGMSVSDESMVSIIAATDCKFLLFDMVA